MKSVCPFSVSFKMNRNMFRKKEKDRRRRRKKKENRQK